MENSLGFVIHTYLLLIYGLTGSFALSGKYVWNPYDTPHGECNMLRECVLRKIIHREPLLLCNLRLIHRLLSQGDQSSADIVVAR